MKSASVGLRAARWRKHARVVLASIHRVGGVALLASLASAACASGGHGLQGPEETALYDRMAGDWVLNEEESTDVATALREAMRGGFGAGGPPGGRGGGGGPPGARGRRPGGGGPPGEGRRMGEGGPAALEDIGPPATLALVVERERISVEGPGILTSLEATPDGEEIRVPRRGGEMKVKARWDDAVLVVERELEDGPKITDRYEAAEEGRLVVVRKAEMRSGPTVELVYVYDRPDEATSGSPPGERDAS